MVKKITRVSDSHHPTIFSGGGGPYDRQVRGRQRGLGRVASGARRTAADPGPVAGHRPRVPGMPEVDYRGLGGEV